VQVVQLAEPHPAPRFGLHGAAGGLDVLRVGQLRGQVGQPLHARRAPRVDRLVAAAVRQDVLTERVERDLRRPRLLPPRLEREVDVLDQERGGDRLEVRLEPLPLVVDGPVLGLQDVKGGPGLLVVGIVERVELDLVVLLVEEPVGDVAVPVHVGDEELGRLELERIAVLLIVAEHPLELGAVLTGLDQGIFDLGRPHRCGLAARQHQRPDQNRRAPGSAHDLLRVEMDGFPLSR